MQGMFVSLRGPNESSGRPRHLWGLDMVAKSATSILEMP